MVIGFKPVINLNGALKLLGDSVLKIPLLEKIDNEEAALSYLDSYFGLLTQEYS